MALKWRQDSVKAIRAKKEAAAKAEAMNAQAQIAVMAFCATATTITDTQALRPGRTFWPPGTSWRKTLCSGMAPPCTGWSRPAA